MKQKKQKAVAMLTALAMLLCCAFPSETALAAKKLSAKEKNRYTKILKNREYHKDSDGLIYSQADFMLYDLNNDGRKELIVTGPLGLRIKFGTVVYSYNGKKFRHATADGEAFAVSKKGIEINDHDYQGAGEVYYKTVTTYTLESNGKLKPRITESESWNYEGKTLSKGYYKHKKGSPDKYNFLGNASKISKASYNKARAKYKLKKIKKNDMHTVSASNIKKYVK